jgi:hypothetical protein
MKRKQQVGECWVCVIFFACVCVGVSDSTTTSDDPSSSVLCVVCIDLFPMGVPGGVGMPPPRLCATFGEAPRNLFFGVFCYF